MKTFIIAEIGINHNGNLKLARQLIDAAASAGCDAVKFQKRTVETVYSQSELDQARKSPWGTTNREQKNGLEFDKKEYDEIDSYCGEKGIHWLASAWDIQSQLFLRPYDCKYNKVASALLTHTKLLELIAEEGKHTFISTGMSTLAQIERATEIFKSHNCPYELMHCVSTYPMEPSDANLCMMDTLRAKFDCDIGYSGHETGVAVSLAAVARGATSLERHITLDRAMYGSDQSASLEISGLFSLVKNTKAINLALGTGEKTIHPQEAESALKLRRYK